MEPALDTIQRALSGDAGACSFLDRTSSIYVLDATDPSKPKTYGCWNFIHQAMNEIERYEMKLLNDNQFQSPQNESGLTNHVKLLATMAVRVARRSPSVDRRLVETCIDNASQYHASGDQSQWLVDLNLELREIVIGRIAAMAFDFSFHKRSGAHGHSAFADPAVMEMFCAVLAANAVSSGPAAISHFISDWIVPSTKTLPPYAVACVVLHLALEALRASAPAGSQDMLQQLSSSVMSVVLVPTLSDAVTESSNHVIDEAADHERNNKIAAVCIRAMERWCAATELSLAQIKHICSKVEINIVDVISDAMYSDSKGTIDALAELIEGATRGNTARYVLGERMKQVRYLMQVDEASFQSNFTSDQLINIESKEMALIIDEMVSAIGLQRFRFVERQNHGDHDVCRSLAQIAVSICTACIQTATMGQPLKTESGLVDLIMKAASHPSVNIAGIAIDALTKLAKREASLALTLLPILQRRAITPHHSISGVPLLAASDICGVNFHEFQNFRENVLAGALVACYEGDGDNYMDSCTSAIEEFCSGNASIEVSLHLEAVLFCLGAVADIAVCSHGPFPHSAQLERCIKALAGKPASMMTNPLTLAQMCQFLKKYTRWYGEGNTDGVLEIATDLALSTFSLSASTFPDNPTNIDIIRETSISPFSEAASTLQKLLCKTAQQFVSVEAMAALGAAWEASYAASNRRNTITIDDRLSLCIGICHVLAALPAHQRIRSFHALALPSLDCFEVMAKMASDAVSRNDDIRIASVLSRVADEIKILTTMSRTFTNACSVNDVTMESGCVTSAKRHDPIPEPLLGIIRKVWPLITHVAATYCDDENISSAMSCFLVDFLPPDCQHKEHLSLSNELCSIAWSIINKSKGGSVQFQPIIDFLMSLIDAYGEALEKTAQLTQSGQRVVDTKQDFISKIQSLLLSTIEAVQSSTGAIWTIPFEQGQGQPPYESKCEVSPKGETNSNDAFAGIFSLLTVCIERCPVFFFRLPASPEDTQDDIFLYHRAVDSAIPALIEVDLQTSKSAIMFLESVIKLSDSHNEEIRRIVLEVLSRIRERLISMLLLGACGKMDYLTLDDAAALLHVVLRTVSLLPVDNHNNLMSVLNHEEFRLGKDSKTVILQLLDKCSRNEMTPSDLKVVLSEIWELHQVDDTHFLDCSDVAIRFATKYRVY